LALAQVERSAANEKPGSAREICGRSVKKILARSITGPPAGPVVTIGTLNSTLSV